MSRFAVPMNRALADGKIFALRQVAGGDDDVDFPAFMRAPLVLIKVAQIFSAVPLQSETVGDIKKTNLDNREVRGGSTHAASDALKESWEKRKSRAQEKEKGMSEVMSKKRSENRAS